MLRGVLLWFLGSAASFRVSVLALLFASAVVVANSLSRDDLFRVSDMKVSFVLGVGMLPLVMGGESFLDHVMVAFMLVLAWFLLYP